MSPSVICAPRATGFGFKLENAIPCARAEEAIIAKLALPSATHAKALASFATQERPKWVCEAIMRFQSLAKDL
jgi:hypothetical protein